MVGDLPTVTSPQSQSFIRQSKPKSLQQAQDIIYSFLLRAVEQRSPEEALIAFKHLFIQPFAATNPEAYEALCKVASANNETEFRNTLKRSCYILVNNWETYRNYKAVKDLTQLFSNLNVSQQVLPQRLRRLRNWLNNFIDSQDFQDLKIFASRHEDQGNWKQRYTAFLLASQYTNTQNPQEQREAAKILSQKLKTKFRFDLAMYIARSQSSPSKTQEMSNPTTFGDELLRLVKIVIAKRGSFTYINLVSIFLRQVRGIKYQAFKLSLREYLIFGMGNQDFAEVLKNNLVQKLELYHQKCHQQPLDNYLLFKTCKKIVDCLTIDSSKRPSPLFIAALYQGNGLTLIVFLLKVVLICHPVITHLETRMSELIQHYEAIGGSEFFWLLEFLELFNITFAIHATNIEYTLVKIANPIVEEDINIPSMPWDDYKVFSQMKGAKKNE